MFFSLAFVCFCDFCGFGIPDFCELCLLVGFCCFWLLGFLLHFASWHPAATVVQTKN